MPKRGIFGPGVFNDGYFGLIPPPPPTCKQMGVIPGGPSVPSNQALWIGQNQVPGPQTIGKLVSGTAPVFPTTDILTIGFPQPAELGHLFVIQSDQPHSEFSSFRSLTIDQTGDVFDVSTVIFFDNNGGLGPTEWAWAFPSNMIPGHLYCFTWAFPS